MDWLTRSAMLLLLIFFWCNGIFGQSIAGQEISTTSNINSAQNFATSFVNYIVASGVFPEQEEEDMKEFVQALSFAISSLTNSKWASHAKIEALCMAFASAMAELVVIEDDDGDHVSSDLKTKVIADALGQAFKETTGSVNEAFIEEIKELIGMFAHAVVSGIDESEDLTVHLPSAPEHSEKLASAFELASGTSSPAAAPPQQPESELSPLTEGLYKALVNDPGFNHVFEDDVTPAKINAIASAIAGSVASVKAFTPVGYSALVKAYMQASSDIKDGAAITDYARVFSNATAQVLKNAGVFTGGISSEHITAAVEAISNGIATASITPTDSVSSTDAQVISDSDIASSVLSSHIPAYTAPAGTPAVAINFAREIYSSLVSDPRFASIFQVPLSAQSVNVYLNAIAKALISINTFSLIRPEELLNSYQEAISGIAPGSASTVYGQTIARVTAFIFNKYKLLTPEIVSSVSNTIKSSLASALTSAAQELSNEITGSVVPVIPVTDTTKLEITPEISQNAELIDEKNLEREASERPTQTSYAAIPDYTAADDTPAVSVAFAKKIYNALISDNRFTNAFVSPLSPLRARLYLSALATEICSIPRFSSITDAELEENYIEAISPIPTPSEPYVYAKEIASDTALIFYENNLLTWQAVTATSAAIPNAVNNALSTASAQDSEFSAATGTTEGTTEYNEQIEEDEKTASSSQIAKEASYTVPAGTTPVARNFGKQIFNSLVSNPKFELLLEEPLSLTNLRLFLTALATSICSIPQFRVVAVNDLTTRYTQAVTEIPAKSELQSYAQVIAQTTAEYMSAKKLLSLQAVSALSDSIDSTIQAALNSITLKSKISVAEVGETAAETTAETEISEAATTQAAAYVTPAGASPAVANLGRGIYSALVSDPTFAGAFSAPFSLLKAKPVIVALARRITSFPQFGGLPLSTLVPAYINAVQKVLPGSDPAAYAQALATTTAQALSAHNLLSPQVVAAVGGELHAAVAAALQATSQDPSAAAAAEREEGFAGEGLGALAAGEAEAGIGEEEEAAESEEAAEEVEEEFETSEEEELEEAAGLEGAAAFVAPAGLTPSGLRFATTLYQKLLSNAAFTSSFRAGLSTQAATATLSQISIALSRLGAFSRLPVAVLTADFTSGLGRLGVGAATSRYAQLVAGSIALEASRRRLITEGQETSLAESVVAAVSSGIEEARSAGVIFGVEEAAAVVEAGETAAETTAETEISEAATTQAAAYVTPAGASPAAANLGRGIYSALVSDPTFAGAFSAPFSLLKAKPVIVALARRITSFPQFGGLPLSTLLPAYINAVQKVSPGSDPAAYAQALATTTAQALSAHNLLSPQVVAAVGGELHSAVAAALQATSQDPSAAAAAEREEGFAGEGLGALAAGEAEAGVGEEEEAAESEEAAEEVEEEFEASEEEELEEAAGLEGEAAFVAPAGLTPSGLRFATTLYQQLLSNAVFTSAFRAGLSTQAATATLSHISTAVSGLGAFSRLPVAVLTADFTSGLGRLGVGAAASRYAQLVAGSIALEASRRRLITDGQETSLAEAVVTAVSSGIEEARSAGVISGVEEAAAIAEAGETAAETTAGTEISEAATAQAAAYVTPAGASPAAANLGRGIYSALVSDPTFAGAFSAPFSLLKAKPVIVALARRITSFPQFGGLPLSTLVPAYINAVQKVLPGSDPAAYAQALATTTAQALSSNNLLSPQAVAAVGSQLHSAVAAALQAASQEPSAAAAAEGEEGFAGEGVRALAEGEAEAGVGEEAEAAESEEAAEEVEEEFEASEEEELEEAGLEGEAAFVAPAGLTPSGLRFATTLYQQLLSNAVFTSAFRAGLSTQAATATLSHISTAVSGLGAFSRLPVAVLTADFTSGLGRLGVGAAASRYAQLVAGSIALEASRRRLITDGQETSLAEAVVTAVSSGIEEARSAGVISGVEEAAAIAEAGETAAETTAGTEISEAATAQAAAYVTPAGASPAAANLGRGIYSALVSDPTFAGAFSAPFSLLKAKPVIVALARRITSFPQFGGLPLSTLVPAYINAVQKVLPGSDPAAYAQALATTTAQALSSNNLLSPQAVAAVGSQLHSAVAAALQAASQEPSAAAAAEGEEGFAGEGVRALAEGEAEAGVGEEAEAAESEEAAEEVEEEFEASEEEELEEAAGLEGEAAFVAPAGLTPSGLRFATTLYQQLLSNAVFTSAFRAGLSTQAATATLSHISTAVSGLGAFSRLPVAVLTADFTSGLGRLGVGAAASRYAQLVAGSIALEASRRRLITDGQETSLAEAVVTAVSSGIEEARSAGVISGVEEAAAIAEAGETAAETTAGTEISEAATAQAAAYVTPAGASPAAANLGRGIYSALVSDPTFAGAFSAPFSLLKAKPVIVALARRITSFPQFGGLPLSTLVPAYINAVQKVLPGSDPAAYAQALATTTAQALSSNNLLSPQAVAAVGSQLHSAVAAALQAASQEPSAAAAAEGEEGFAGEGVRALAEGEAEAGVGEEAEAAESEEAAEEVEEEFATTEELEEAAGLEREAAFVAPAGLTPSGLRFATTLYQQLLSNAVFTSAFRAGLSTQAATATLSHISTAVSGLGAFSRLPVAVLTADFTSGLGRLGVGAAASRYAQLVAGSIALEASRRRLITDGQETSLAEAVVTAVSSGIEEARSAGVISGVEEAAAIAEAGETAAETTAGTEISEAAAAQAAAYVTPAGASPAAANLGRGIYSALVSDPTFAGAFSAPFSLLKAKPVIVALARRITSFPQFGGLPLSTLVPAYINAVQKVLPGSDPAAYAQALATTTAQSLSSNNLLSRQAVAAVGSQLHSAVAAALQAASQEPSAAAAAEGEEGFAGEGVRALAEGEAEAGVGEEEEAAVSEEAAEEVEEEFEASEEEELEEAAGLEGEAAFVAPAGLTPSGLRFATTLYQQLLSNAVFTSAFRAGLSTQAATATLSHISTAVSGLGAFSRLPVAVLTADFTSGLGRLGVGAAASRYAQLVAGSIALEASRRRLITDGQETSLAEAVVTAVSSGIEEARSAGVISGVEEAAAIAEAGETAAETTAGTEISEAAATQAAAYVTPAGASPAAANLGRGIYSALVSDPTFAGAFSAPFSLLKAKPVIVALARRITSFPQFGGLPLSTLVPAYINAVQKVLPGSDPAAYAQALATTTAQALSSNNLLSPQAVAAVRSQLHSAVAAALQAASQEPSAAAAAEGEEGFAGEGVRALAEGEAEAGVGEEAEAAESEEAAEEVEEEFEASEEEELEEAAGLEGEAAFVAPAGLTPSGLRFATTLYQQLLSNAVFTSAFRAGLSTQAATATLSHISTAVSGLGAFSRLPIAVLTSDFTSGLGRLGVGAAASRYAQLVAGSIALEASRRRLITDGQETSLAEAVVTAVSSGIEEARSAGVISGVEEAAAIAEAGETAAETTAGTEISEAAAAQAAAYVTPAGASPAAANLGRGIYSALVSDPTFAGAFSAPFSLLKAKPVLVALARRITSFPQFGRLPLSALVPAYINAVQKVPPGSDPAAYAQALATTTAQALSANNLLSPQAVAAVGGQLHSAVAAALQATSQEPSAAAAAEREEGVADEGVTAFAAGEAAAGVGEAEEIAESEESVEEEEDEFEASEEEDLEEAAGLEGEEAFVAPAGLTPSGLRFATILYQQLLSNTAFTSAFRAGLSTQAATATLSHISTAVIRLGAFSRLPIAVLTSDFNSGLSRLGVSSAASRYAQLVAGSIALEASRRQLITEGQEASLAESVVTAVSSGIEEARSAGVISGVEEAAAVAEAAETAEEITDLAEISEAAATKAAAYVTPAGASPAAANLGSGIYSALVSDPTFAGAFSAPFSLIKARPVVVALARRITSFPQFGRLPLSTLVPAYISAVQRVTPGSDPSVYAQELARTTAEVLSANNLLSPQAVAAVGGQLHSALAAALQATSQEPSAAAAAEREEGFAGEGVRALAAGEAEAGVGEAEEAAESEEAAEEVEEEFEASEEEAELGVQLSAIELSFAKEIYNAILGNPAFSSAFSSHSTLEHKQSFLNALANHITKIPEFSTVQLNELFTSYSQALASTSTGTALSTYARIIAQTTAKELYLRNLLTLEAITATSAEVEEAISEALEELSEEIVQAISTQVASVEVTAEISKPYAAPAGASPTAANLGRGIYSALVSDPTFAGAFSAPFSLLKAKPVLVALARRITSFPQFGGLPLSALVPAYINAVQKVSPGSDPAAYAQALATTTAQALSANNLLSPQAVAAVGGQLHSAVAAALQATSQEPSAAAAAEREEGVAGEGVTAFAAGEAAAGVGEAEEIAESEESAEEEEEEFEAFEEEDLEEAAGLEGEEAFVAPAGLTPSGLRFATILYQQLLSNTAFTSAFRAGLSTQAATATLSHISTAVIRLGAFSRLPIAVLTSDFNSGLSRLGVSSAASRYAQLVAGSIALEASRRQLITEGQEASLAESVVTAVSSGIEEARSAGVISGVEEAAAVAEAAETAEEITELAEISEAAATKAAAYVTPAGASPAAANLGSGIYSALVSDPTFAGAFSAPFSLIKARPVVVALARRITSFPQFGILPLSTLVPAYISAVQRVTPGSDPSVYAQELARTTAEVLSANNLLSPQAVAAVGGQLHSALAAALQATSQEPLAAAAAEREEGFAGEGVRALAAGEAEAGVGEAEEAAESEEAAEEVEEEFEAFEEEAELGVQLSAVELSFAKEIYNAILGNPAFSSAFSSHSTLEHKQSFLNALANHITKIPEFSTVQLNELFTSYSQALASTSTGTALSTYARIIAQTTAKELYLRNLLTLEAITATSAEVEEAISEALEELSEEIVQAISTQVASVEVTAKISKPYAAPAGASPTAANLGRGIYSALVSDPTFAGAFSAPFSLLKAKPVLVALARRITSFPQFGGLPLSALVPAYINAVQKVSPGSDPAAYAQALATTTAQALSANNLLSPQAVAAVGGQLHSAVAAALQAASQEPSAAAAAEREEGVAGEGVTAFAAGEAAAGVGEAEEIAESEESAEEEEEEFEASEEEDLEEAAGLEGEEAFVAPAGLTPSGLRFATILYQQLLSNTAFTSAFRAGLSTQAATATLSHISTAVIRLGAFSRLPIAVLTSDFNSGLSRLGVSSAASRYAQLVAGSIALEASRRQLITEGQEASLAESVVTAVSSGIEEARSAGVISGVEEAAAVAEAAETAEEITELAEISEAAATKAAAYVTPAGTSPAAANLGSGIYSALVSDPTFAGAFSAPFSLIKARPVVVALARRITSFPQFGILPLSTLVPAYISAVQRVTPGSDPSVYAQELARTTAEVLSANNLLSPQAVAAVGGQLHSALAAALQATSQEPSAAAAAEREEGFAGEGVRALAAGEAEAGVGEAEEAAESEEAAEEVEEEFEASEEEAELGVQLSAVELSFAKEIYNAILGNPAFSSAFSSHSTLEHKQSFLNALANHITKIPEFSTVQLNELFTSYSQALASTSTGTALSTYARIIAQTTAKELYLRNLLTLEAITATSAEVEEAISEALEELSEEIVQAISTQVASVEVTAKISKPYAAPAGASPTAANLGRGIYSALVSDPTFAGAFSAPFSLLKAKPVLVALARRITSFPQFGGLPLSALVPAYINAVQKVSPGSDPAAYAQALATTTAQALSANNLLSPQAVAAVGGQLHSAVAAALQATSQEPSAAAAAEREEGVAGEGVTAFAAGEAAAGVGEAEEIAESEESAEEEEEEFEASEEEDLEEAAGLEGEEAFVAPAGLTPSGLRFATILYQQLLSNTAFTSAFRAGLSTQAATATLSHISTAVIRLGAFSRLPIAVLTSDFNSGLSHLGVSSAASRYAQLVAGSIALEASRRQLITEGKEASLAESVVTAVSSGIEEARSAGVISGVEEAAAVAEAAETAEEITELAEISESAATKAAAYVTPAGASPAAANLGSGIYSALVSDPTFAGAFSAPFSLIKARPVVVALARRITSFPQFGILPLSTLVPAYINAVQRVTPGSDPSVYAQQLASTTAQTLSANNLLSPQVVAAVGGQLQTAVFTALQATSQQPSAAAAAEREEGFAGEEVETARESRLGTKISESSSTVALEEKPKSMLPLHEGYVRVSGSTDLETAFGAHLYGTLLVNPQLSKIFGQDVSLASVKPFLSALADRIHSFSAFSSLPSSNLLDKYVNAVSQMPPGSSEADYAQIIAQTTAKTLSENNLLTWNVLAMEEEESEGSVSITVEEHVQDLSSEVASTSAETTSVEIATSAILSPSVLITLSSASAEKRVSDLLSVIISSLPLEGQRFNFASFAQQLSRSISQIKSSNPSLSSTDAVIEGLLEALTALLQVLQNANVKEINAENSVYIKEALTESLKSVFVV
ncbi:LOW QUALITY PROTEIN: uncharacterized protein LOC129231303 [Uloborus diversus]|uniref:LOW QUALITY PROTEIN: uncharacterized protein LOC129231303 n=1 Tax=Uloborus diversus TaxID=327109 RepID=UPI0024094DA0|nr:LOW QUALITY PROTEIN: uncharacterized protein LOC129231303 [Uloborus diversus]